MNENFLLRDQIHHIDRKKYKCCQPYTLFVNNIPNVGFMPGYDPANFKNSRSISNLNTYQNVGKVTPKTASNINPRLVQFRDGVYRNVVERSKGGGDYGPLQSGGDYETVWNPTNVYPSFFRSPHMNIRRYPEAPYSPVYDY
jgi:hypothetical protein